MKGTRSVNAELNRVLGLELIAINQYFLHARMLKNWGYRVLGEKAYKSSIHAMKEADRIIERVLFLEGLPNLQDLGALRIGQKVPEILSADLTLETALRTALAEVIAHCEKETDFVSREMLSKIEEASEERIDFFETQQGMLKDMGLPNYLQFAAGEMESE